MLQYTEFTQKITEAYVLLTSTIERKERSEEDCRNAFKDIVKICIPSVNNLLGNKAWGNLWEKYQQRAEHILQNPEVQNNCIYFIDYALFFTDNRFSNEEKMQVYKLFNAFDNTIQALIYIIKSDKTLINKFQEKLNAKIKAAITDGPKKADNSNNSSFKNFVNEIAFFYHMAIHKEFELEDIESPLPNGKTVDFKLRWGNDVYLIDTITIHCTARQNDINRFIEGKVNDKFASKTKNIEEGSILGQFKVLPIIEYNDSRLFDYAPMLPEAICFPPMMPLLHEEGGKSLIILEQLPLDEIIKNQFIKNDENI